jgi:hypothetical protein
MARPLSAWDSFKDGIALVVGGTMLIGTWIVIALIALVVGLAVVKWAVEELVK